MDQRLQRKRKRKRRFLAGRFPAVELCRTPVRSQSAGGPHYPANDLKTDRQISIIADKDKSRRALFLQTSQYLASRLEKRCLNLIELGRRACWIFAISSWHVDYASNARSCQQNTICIDAVLACFR